MLLIRGGVKRGRSLGLLSSVMLGIAVGGCGISGIDGIELQGGVFDALGVSGSQKPSIDTVKVAPRPGLVIPPANYQLPDPNKPQVAAAPPVAGGMAWPVDEKTLKAQRAAELERRHKAYCEKALQNGQLTGETDGIIGPNGPCQPGIFGAATTIFNPEKNYK